MTMLEAMFTGMGMVLIYGLTAILLVLHSHRNSHDVELHYH
jgi:hypothetical protein